MTARRDASRPLSSSRLREEGKGAAERAKANPDWFIPSPRQEPEKGPASAAGIHAHVVGAAVAGSGAAAADESSDSEAEQEGPQKLIRKVSTSGQIRSKVSRRRSRLSPARCLRLDGAGGVFLLGIRGGWVGLFRGKHPAG